MTKLADFGVPYTTVGPSNGPLSVRGLSFSDITHLFKRYAPIFIEIYQTFPKPKEKELIVDYLARPDVVSYMKKELSGDLLTAAPDLVAEIIACGSDARGDDLLIEAADNLPIGIQLDVTSAILVATVSGFSGVGKMKEIVGPILEEAINAAKDGTQKA